MTNSIDAYILNYAAGRDSFTLGQVYESYLEQAPIGRSIITWHLGNLATKGKISRIGKGIYAKSDKTVFSPELSNEAKEVFRLLHVHFPATKFCIYEGPWISPLLHHLASNQVIYVEVERLAAESVFEQLKMSGRPAYYRPDEEMIYRYINLDRRVIFVKPMVSESPVAKSDGIPVASLEKMLVDIYTDPDFYFLQGGEYHSIIANAKSLYTINTSKLFRYAARRGVKEEISKIYNESL